MLHLSAYSLDFVRFSRGHFIMSSPFPLFVPEDSEFSIDNLPYGVFSTRSNLSPRIGVAIGCWILDIQLLVKHGLFADLDFDMSTLRASTLNQFAALGPEVHAKFRTRLQDAVKKDGKFSKELQDICARQQSVLVDMEAAQMCMPMDIRGYTDVLAGFHHTDNVHISTRQTLESALC